MNINFSNMFQNLADKFGSNEALVNVERNRRYTFSEYHLVTNRIVNMMNDVLELKVGDRFINIIDNDNMTLLHLPTILKGHATAVFTNYRDALSEHIWQVDYAKPTVAFIENVLLDSHAEMLTERGIKVVCMDKLDDKWQNTANVYDFWQLVEQASDVNPNIELDNIEHLCLIRFTGGTTGKGKPAAYSIDNWFGSRDGFYGLEDSDWTEHTRVLLIAPISHGSSLFILPALCAGACTVTMNLPDLEHFCQIIEHERISATLLVPTLLYRLLELPQAQQYDLSSLSTIFYGAAPMSPSKLELLQQKFGNIFVQIYAATEQCAVALSLSKSDHIIENTVDIQRLSSTGRITSAVEVILVDDDGKPVKRGEVGELWMRSRSTISGYFDNPEKSALEFSNGFWKSGDVAKMDDDGYIAIVDRKKDMIISGGFNIYATEVEAVINAFSPILMSAVVGVPNEQWGECVHAEVMLREGETLDTQELTDYVKANLGSYKAPKSITVVTQLPMSAVGKVLRREVRDKYWKNRDRKVG